MPYQWTDTPEGPIVLTLSAHNSLTPKGFVLMISLTAALISLPLVSVLGTALLWWMLPFLMAAVAALWYALRRSNRDRQISEVLGRQGDELTLTQQPGRGRAVSWTCNVYWVRAQMHKTGGPVEHYVTLSGAGRTVEIGRFLSEDERKTLYTELVQYLSGGARPD